MRHIRTFSRRKFLKKIPVVLSIPYFIPKSLMGQKAPSNQINVGCIGTGRMGGGDLIDILDQNDIRLTAVCDVDEWRLENSKNQVEAHYQKELAKGRYFGCKTYRDYRELIDDPTIDAVMICTPDHWHALPAIAAAKAGKDIFIQKPLTLTIPEGRILSDTVRRYHNILQVGSQQRSDSRFRFAVELVRNGRIGKLHTVKIGFGKDPFTGIHSVKKIPKELDYDFWLGPTPYVEYIEERVHPQKSYDRPGWLRTKAYCCGMITGWGSHHLDIAHWGIDVEYSGPVEIFGEAEYAKDGSWDVHGAFRTEYLYQNGVKMIVTHNEVNQQGVLFEGTTGWVYVRRGYITADPDWLLKEQFGPDEIHLYHSTNHKRNWIDCIKSRKEPVAPVEIGHRSGTACILGYIAMDLNRKLKWNPEKEQFMGDEAANRMLNREYRSPWQL